MSKASALAAATGGTTPAPTTSTAPNPAGLAVTARQASRIPVTDPSKPPTGAAPTVTPVVLPVVEPPPANLDSDRFAHLAKKEAAIQKEREALKAEREANAAEKARYEEVGAKYRSFEEMRVKDPIAAMKLAGFTDTDIFNFYAKAQEDAKAKDTPEAKAVAAAEAKIKEFEDRQAKAQEAQRAESDAGVIKRYQSHISRVVTGDKDKFEFCNFNGPVAESLIYDTVVAHFEATKDPKTGQGEVLSPQEAAEMVEKYYEDQDKAMSALKKRGGKVETAPPEPPPAIPPASKTLTNKVTPTVASSIPKAETREQKRERLINDIKTNGLRK